MDPKTTEALVLAIARHHGQLRKKTGEPYVIHPVRVARLAVDEAVAQGLPAEQVARIELAALLHDTLEDTETTPEELSERFGDDVAAIVGHLTQDKSLPKPERRKRMVEHAGDMPFEAQVVKLADRLDNMASAHQFDEAFRARYCAEARGLLAAMAGAAPGLEAELLVIVEATDPATP